MPYWERSMIKSPQTELTAPAELASTEPAVAEPARAASLTGASTASGSAYGQALVALLRKTCPSAPPDLLGLALQAASASERGDVCVNIPPGSDLAAWRASGAVGAPGEFCPLIAEAGRLYLARYHAYEAELAARLTALCARELAPPAGLAAQLTQLFGPAGKELDWQRVAATAAQCKALMVISGGPGTGKTTTLVKLLALFQAGALQTAGTPLNIRLAAPTGKAANRMQEAIRNARSQLTDQLAPEVLAALPTEASTLHRLLGSRPDSVRFVHHAGHPLALDVLVVDEASMVDLALMSKLLAALPSHARLVLLGDKDQLASVEAGAVLGDLCSDVGLSPAFAAQLSALTGQPVQPEFSPSQLGDHVITLVKSYRFSGQIGQLARAINQEQIRAVFELLQPNAMSPAALPASLNAAPPPELAWLAADPASSGLPELLAPLWAAYQPYLAAVANYASAQTTATLAGAELPSAAPVFAAFDAFRVLSPLRRGAASVEQVNALLEQQLARRGHKLPEQQWYAGRPVLIPQNLYELGLFNGDIGLTLPDASGKLWVHFLQADGSTRCVSPARLANVETAFAMTVHKSQGSEFAHVLLLLPAGEAGAGQLLSRELVYTAITRAKTRVTLWGDERSVRQAVARKVERQSGLAQRLLR